MISETWEEITTVDKKAAPLPPQAWACDCQSRTSRNSHNNCILEGIFKPTKVNAEGICIKCGHYALKMDKKFLAEASKRRGVNRNNAKSKGKRK